jgi:hypothetical protein
MQMFINLTRIRSHKRTTEMARLEHSPTRLPYLSVLEFMFLAKPCVLPFVTKPHA